MTLRSTALSMLFHNSIGSKLLTFAPFGSIRLPQYPIYSLTQHCLTQQTRQEFGLGLFIGGFVSQLLNSDSTLQILCVFLLLQSMANYDRIAGKADSSPNHGFQSWKAKPNTP